MPTFNLCLAALSTLLGAAFSFPTQEKDFSGMYFSTNYVVGISWTNGDYAIKYDDPDTTINGEWLQIDWASYAQINNAIADHSPISGELNKSAEGRYVLTIEN